MVRKVDKVAAVAAINLRQLFMIVCLTGMTSLIQAAILPEDRADALFHVYDGGGVTISGPSILVRKEFAQKFSVSGSYYVDSISSASIDVITRASEYSEERTENSVGIDYLHNKTIMGLAYTKSDENDFNAQSAHFTISQDLFGDLSTLSLGYSRGWDEVGRRGDPLFSKDVDRHHYRLSLSQIVTKNLLLNLGYEAITDEGFLNNPYRKVRYLGNSNSQADATQECPSGRNYCYEDELYPNTRTSNSIALRSIYYLAHRAALKGEYRYFTDTWGIGAQTYEIGYTYPTDNHWIYDFRYRYYRQKQASFYNDLFAYQEAQSYRARDKELSTYNNHTFGVSASYEFLRKSWKFIDRGTINFAWDHIRFQYDNFRDLRTETVIAGDEPLYKFSANIFQTYISVWY